MPGKINFIERGKGKLTIVFLHFFGGSARTWEPVIARLSDTYHCIAVDLPGFGDSPAPDHVLSVNEQGKMVAELLQELKINRFVLAGHSMGGKIALSIAAQCTNSVDAIILIAPSPPTPEPSDENSRKELSAAWHNRHAIEKLVNKITAALPEEILYNQCVEDHLKVARIAWDGWIEKGSREDISDEIKAIDLPVILLSGSQDPNFSPDFLKKEFTKYFPSLLLKVLPGGHLLPIECTTAVTAIVKQFLSEHVE